MIEISGFILLGLVAGILSGVFGIGGGIIIVPALVLLFGLGQHQAQGTTLALLVPPIGLVAAWAYYRQGYVDVKVAALICMGFLVGGFIGAEIARHISDSMLRRAFGLIMLVIAIRMIASK